MTHLVNTAARCKTIRGVCSSTKVLPLLLPLMTAVPAFAQGGGSPFNSLIAKVSTLMTSNVPVFFGIGCIMYGFIVLMQGKSFGHCITPILLGGTLLIGHQAVFSWLS